MKKFPIDIVIILANIFFYSLFLYLKQPILIGVLSVPLMLFYPGFLLSKIIPAFNLNQGFFGKISFQVLYSFFAITILGYIAQSVFGINSFYQVFFLVFLNLFLTVLYLAKIALPNFKFPYFKVSLINERKGSSKYQVRFWDYIPPIILSLILSILLFINPLAQDADGYLTLIYKSIHVENNILHGRPIFGSLIIFMNKFSEIDIRLIFRNIFVILFFFSTLSLYDYILSNYKNRFFGFSIYLFVFTVPVILSELNIIRPQLGVIIFTIPVLLSLVRAAKFNSILSGIVGLSFALVATKFHELGSVLILISFLTFFIIGYQLTFIKKILTLKEIVIWLIIALPYLYIFKVNSFFEKALVQINYASTFIDGLSWRWWFIDNYKSVDGADLSWSGINVLYYYLYNGLFVLILLLIILIYYIIKRNKLKSFVLIPSIYLIIHLVFAEILPRIGLYFLPNRAWIHLMLAAIILVAILIKNFQRRYITIVIILATLVNLTGAFFVSLNNTDIIFKKELPIAKFIKNELPEDSIILSSQDNRVLVNIYTDKHYSRINIDKKVNKQDFQKTVDSKLNNLSKDQRRILQPKILKTTSSVIDGKIIKEKTTVVKPQLTELTRAVYKNNTPVYFLYSYVKNKGIGTQREYLKTNIDLVNQNVYPDLGYEIVYHEKNGLVLKIK